MSILSKMSKLFNIVTSDTKSSDIEISKLLQYSKINIPSEKVFSTAVYPQGIRLCILET